MVAEDLDDVYDGNLDDGDWAVADLESTPKNAVDGRSRKIRKSFPRFQQAQPKAAVEVPQNLLKLLSSLAEEPNAAPSPSFTPDFEGLEARCTALREEVGRSRERSRERLLALESKLVAKLSNAKAKRAKLKTPLDANAARTSFSEGELEHLKDALAKRFEMQLVALLLISSSSWTLFSER